MNSSTPRVLYLPRPSRVSHFIKSRLRRIDIDLETVKAVMDRFGLEMTAPPANLPLSRRTQNVMVSTPHGRKVMKRYRSRQREPSIIYGHSILARLAEVDFPAPRLALAPDGSSFVGHAGDLYALFDFVAGVNYSLNYMFRQHRLRLMVLAGHTLARLHRQLEGFLPQGRHYLGFSSYEGSWQRDVNWFASNVAALIERSRQIPDEVERRHAAWLVDHSSYILEELVRLDETLGRVPLPRLIIHGDYGLHNLVFQKGGQVTPMDFESARLEWRLSDLVSALSRLRQANGIYDFESIDCLMEGYQAVYPLLAEEWRAFPQVWRFYKLRSALIYWNNYIETGSPLRKLVSARSAVEQADWIRNHPEALMHLKLRTGEDGARAGHGLWKATRDWRS